MEITGKSFSNIIKEAEEKGLQVVLIGAGAEIGKHAELIAKMSKNKSVLLVPIADLPQEDQDRIQAVTVEKRDFLKEIIDGSLEAINKDMGKLKLEASNMEDIILQEKVNSKKNHPLPKFFKPNNKGFNNIKNFRKKH